MKRINRKRRLTPQEAAKSNAIREQVAQELPDLIARHHDRMVSLDQLHELLRQLKASREAKGLSLADLTELTGMDRSAISKLETGQRRTRRSKRWCATPRPLESGWWFLWWMRETKLARAGGEDRQTMGRTASGNHSSASSLRAVSSSESGEWFGVA